MHYRELTNEVLKFVKSGGKTPAATLRSAMGRDRRFIKIGRGFYKLAGLGDQPTIEPIQLKASDDSLGVGLQLLRIRILKDREELLF